MMSCVEGHCFHTKSLQNSYGLFLRTCLRQVLDRVFEEVEKGMSDTYPRQQNSIKFQLSSYHSLVAGISAVQGQDCV